MIGPGPPGLVRFVLCDEEGRGGSRDTRYIAVLGCAARLDRLAQWLAGRGSARRCHAAVEACAAACSFQGHRGWVRGIGRRTSSPIPC
jgi:hypothetical protein